MVLTVFSFSGFAKPTGKKSEKKSEVKVEKKEADPAENFKLNETLQLVAQLQESQKVQSAQLQSLVEKVIALEAKAPQEPIIETKVPPWAYWVMALNACVTILLLVHTFKGESKKPKKTKR